MTKTDKALAAWNAMTPMQRIEIMRQVPASKSMTVIFRACIAFLVQQEA